MAGEKKKRGDKVEGVTLLTVLLFVECEGGGFCVDTLQVVPHQGTYLGGELWSVFQLHF